MPEPATNRRQADRRRAARGGRRAGDRSGRHPTIVIADAYDAARSACVRYLSNFAFRVEEARSGPEALAAIHAFAPEVVIADEDLPDLSIEALARPLADGATRAIPLIMVSAAFAQVAKPAPDAFRPAGHLRKPFTLSRLLRELRRVLRARLASPESSA